MRDFSKMNSTDKRMALQRGKGFLIENIEITPYSLGEIEEIGYSNYIKKLEAIFFEVPDFLRLIEDIEVRMELEAKKSELKVFDFLINPSFMVVETLLESLSVILRTDDFYVIDNVAIIVNGFASGFVRYDGEGTPELDDKKIEENVDEVKLITRDNFDEICRAVKLMNYLEKVEQLDDGKPADEATRLLMEQMKKNRERVERIKKKDKADKEEEMDIVDVISAVSTASNYYNRNNIWDATLFQLYDEYARLETIDAYRFSVKAMMAGAENIDLKHWSSRI